MRVVVDTNVFISATLKEGSPPSAAVHLAAERDLLRKSALTEQELFVTVDRPAAIQRMTNFWSSLSPVMRM